MNNPVKTELKSGDIKTVFEVENKLKKLFSNLHKI
jgi:hypothetical protein